jgi:hypothetical protein
VSSDTVVFASDHSATVRNVTGGSIRIVPGVGGEFCHHAGEGSR